MNFDNFIDSSHNFLEPLLKEFTSAKLIGKNDIIDHICYKPKLFSEYEVLKKLIINANNQLLSEVIINGRPIATYKLKTAINRSGFTIDYLELAAPKLGHHKESAWDHIEVVVKSTLKEFRSKNSHHKWNSSNIDSKLNPDISLKLASGIVKFHTSPLSKIINTEKILSRNKNKDKAIFFDLDGTITVSYTHLTLPTICSV